MATKKTVSKANPYFKVSLGSVAKKGNPMRKADLPGTYKALKRRANYHYIESQTDYDGNGGVSTYNMTERLKYKKALGQANSLKKAIKKKK